jgi:Rrf2 family protein
MVSQTAEYALRALSELASADTPLRALDLAERTGVPVAYLAKILRQLVAHGLLRASKGHGGGFALARSPGRIRFVDVLDALDSLPTRGRCAFGWGTCNSAQPCPLHPAWARLNAAFDTWATTTTLADVGSARGPRRS